MTRLHRFLFVAVVPVALLAAACGGSVAGPEPSTSATAAATVAPVAVQTHGIVHQLGAALGQVPLRPDQRAQIEQLATAAEARHEQGAAARKDLELAIAAQVDQGTIDKTALQPKLDAVTASLNASRPADRAAFEQLHAILDPDQRVAFVNALEASHEGGAHGGHRGHAHGGGDGMHAWARDLQLTDEQKTQIRDAVRAAWKNEAGEQERQHGEARHGGGPGGGEHAVFEAFKGDHFVMDEVAPIGTTPLDRATQMEDRMISLLQAALPILTPAQRTLAAQKLRDRANGGGDEAPEAPQAAPEPAPQQ